MEDQPFTNNTNPTDSIRFPPFPQSPPGVTVISFKDFQVHGIRIPSNDGGGESPELDGLGIPTVKLRIKHQMDEINASTKSKKKKKRKIGATHGIDPDRMEWWEVWEEGEGSRVIKQRYDVETSAPDRFIRAAEEFKEGRIWPSGIGIAELWDTFRRYIGLLSDESAFRDSKDAPDSSKEKPDLSDDDDDYDEDCDPPLTEENIMNRGILHTYPNGQNDLLDRKLQEFLDNPEKSLRIFFSSYMREKGLIWSPRNLENAPRIIGFFMKFIARNKILPSHQALLERGIHVVELAFHELPLTAKIGQSLPDDFHDGCRSLWGSRSRGLGEFMSATESKFTCDSLGSDGNANGNGPRNHDPGRTVLSGDKGLLSTITCEQGLEIVNPDSIENIGVAQEIASDAGMRFQEPGWGVTDVSGSSTNTDWDNTNSWSTGENAEPIVDGWAPPDNHFLMKLLGPTILPLSHETGVVEWSLRRIKAVYPPLGCSQNINSKMEENAHSTRASGNPQPLNLERPTDEDQLVHGLDNRAFTTVEEGALHTFGRMVLEPWLGWDTGHESDISEPRVLSSSRPTLADSQKSHDPLIHNITVLITPEIVTSGILSVGMGLGATWVQITRRQDSKPSPGAAIGDGYFWYMEQLMSIFPSYYLQPS